LGIRKGIVFIPLKHQIKWTFKLKNSDSLRTTVKIAEKHNISSRFLFGFLTENDYLRKIDGKYTVTNKGVSLGASYIEYEDGTGRGVGWSGNQLDEIIKKDNWPVDIKKAFSKIQKDASQRLNSNEADIDYLHDHTISGRKVLETREELDSYIRSYGAMHKEKMKKAYKELNRRSDLSRLIAGRRFQVIDYACGQGVATIIFVEYLRDIKVTYNIRELILVEPSKVALEIGARNFTGHVKKVNKYFDDLLAQDIATSGEHMTFHLFSNILDMGDEYFNLRSLAKTILNSQKGTNYFICVSPLAKGKLDAFMSYFDGHIEVSSFLGEIPNPSTHPESKPWQVAWNIFKVEL